LGTFEKGRAAAVAGIAAGMPVLIDSEESGLVLGYTDEGKTLLGRPPYHGGDGYVPLKQIQFLVGTRIPGTDLFAPWVITTLMAGKAIPERGALLRAFSTISFTCGASLRREATAWRARPRGSLPPRN
jgi:hypothetical protein